MRWILLFPLIAAMRATGLEIADGSGLFPVLVQVVQAGRPVPVPGAVVKLEGLRPYVDTELDPAKRADALAATLGRPVATNAEGFATVLYPGKWSSTTTEGRHRSYFRTLEGILVIAFEGKEIRRIDLKDWAKEREPASAPDSVPWITVEIPAKE